MKVAGKKYVQIVTRISLAKGELPAEVVYIEGIRYNRETKLDKEHREDYEPGGRYEHLRDVLEH